MSLIEKLEEIVRALESLTEELAAEIEGRYASTKDHPAMERRYRADMEDVKVGRRAITLARELRENAVEGWAHLDDSDEPYMWEVYEESYTRGVGRPAILITDPNP